MRTLVRISNEFSAKANTSNLKFSRNTKAFGKTLIHWSYYLTRMDWRKYDLNFDAYFTNIGKAYVDILKCIKTMSGQEDVDEVVLAKLQSIEKIIYFQCLVLMMKNKDCNYAQDFFDVLRFVDCYGSIDSTEYLLIQYEREHCEGDYITEMADIVNQYRQKEMEVNVNTKTKNDEKGATKSVNSFPYVNGNFSKAGVFVKDDFGRFLFNMNRYAEIQSAIREVSAIWQNSVQ